MVSASLRAGNPAIAAIQCGASIMRTRTTVVAVVVGLILFTGTVRLLSQDFPFTIDLDVPLVSVDFTVVDTTGKPVTDLNRYDFQVFDNGVSRPIQNFSPVQSPYNLVLLLDCSGSTQDRVNMLVSAIARFADQLRPQDKAVVAVFGSEVAVVADWNGVKKPLNLKDSPVCRGTGFYDALSWAEKKLRGIAGRRGIVVFSDGADSDMARKSVKIDGISVRRIVPPAEDQEFQKVAEVRSRKQRPILFRRRGHRPESWEGLRWPSARPATDPSPIGATRTRNRRTYRLSPVSWGSCPDDSPDRPGSRYFL
jgi:hypothetical protein